MRFEDFVGVRYLMAKRDRNMLSVITLISIGGVAVGVMALIVVLSVMGGFESDFREKIIGSKSHVVISAKEGYIKDYEAIKALILDTPRVEGVNAYVEAEVMLNSPTNLQAAILRGIDHREIVTTTKLGEYMEEGKLAYLEDPDALPSIVTAGTVMQRGSLTLHSDREDGEISPERADKLEKAGARAAIAFAGSKHGNWLSEDGAIDTETVTQEGASDSLYALSEVDAEAPEAQSKSSAPERVAAAPEEERLAALVGEDRWIDEALPVASRSLASLTDESFDRMPTADLLPRQSRARQMKVMPGLTAEDTGVRRVGAIILGRELKNNLTLYLGGELNIMSPSGDVGPAGNLPKSRPFKVVGSYYSGMFDFDAKMAYISLQDAQTFLGIGDTISGIDVRCSRLEDSLSVRDALRVKLASYPNLQVDDWRTLNGSLFSAIMLEKVAMFVILASIILVASFNILCLLIMMVIEKAREIAIFKAMGTTDRSIVRMFVVQGGVIGVLGTLIGLALGLGLCYVIMSLGIKMPGNVHYITQIPVDIDPVEIVFICIAAIGISLLATVLPSRMAVKLDPVEGLRCE